MPSLTVDERITRAKLNAQRSLDGMTHNKEHLALDTQFLIAVICKQRDELERLKPSPVKDKSSFAAHMNDLFKETFPNG